MIIAADPGKKGGLCGLYNDGTIYKVVATPVQGKDIDWHKITAFIKECVVNARGEAIIGVIEKVHAMPGNGACSMFSFGGAYHGLRAVYAALDLRCELVTPQRWKKVVLAGSKKDKAATINYCRSAWPKQSLMATPGSRTPHDGIADAICIAEFGRREYSPAAPVITETQPGTSQPEFF